MTPTRWMQCWLCLLGAGLATAGWQSSDASSSFAAHPERSASHCECCSAPNSSQREASPDRSMFCVELLAEEEADDVEGDGARLKSAGKFLPSARPRLGVLGQSGSSPPLWAYKAAFFPNTLHVRLQL